MGDFNIGLPNYESHHLTEEYINTFNFLSFQSLLTKPTRITNHSATLTDHIFSICSIVTPLAEILFTIFLMIYQTSYYLTVLTFQTSLKKVFKRDYSNCDRNSLIEDFKKINWTYQFHSHKIVDEVYETFYYKLSRKADKQTATPWITPAIKTLINIKNNYCKNVFQTSMTFILQNSNYIAIAYSFS